VKLRERHGRKDEATEYFEYQVILPTVIAQRMADRWMVGITHTDGTWQVPLYLDTLADAKCQARQLAQRYATAEHYSVEEDVKLARAFAEELQATRATRKEA
jgi:hypothetical protein